MDYSTAGASFTGHLPQPVFLLSLPRTGSTLLQRLLAAHPDIETTSEPNVLLFLLLSVEPDVVYSLVGHEYVWTALSEFVAQLPNGREGYLHEIGALARRLYARAATKDARYFLDKSPNYCYVVDDLVRAFADGRFIFLWRHPLAVAASMLRFPGIGDPGRWTLYRSPVLFDGLARLIEACQQNQERVIGVRYEDLVSAPKRTLGRLLAYLHLRDEWDLEASLPGVNLPGTLGDPNMRRPEYQCIRRDRVDDWRATFCNPLRKRWAREYLQWIGEERLAVMGYDLDQLLAELDAVPTSLHLLRRDAYWMSYGFFYRLLNGRMLRDNLRRWRAGEPFWAYR